MTGPVEPTARPRGEVPQRRRARDLRLVLTGVVAVLLVWFALANLQDVKIDFWIRTSEAPLIEVVLISGVLGGVVGGLLRRRRRPTADGPTSP